MRPQCTDNKTGRPVLRHRDERYVDRLKSYRGIFAYEKALRKRRVWVEPSFGKAKDWNGLRRFRLRRLEKVNIEALPITSGQNIKRLVAARERGPREVPKAQPPSGGREGFPETQKLPNELPQETRPPKPGWAAQRA